MATITEDYVSFETAKLLKEKGFDGECSMYYDIEEIKEMEENGDLETPEPYEVNRESLMYDYIGIYIKAPTQAMVMKWLRIVHNIHISVYVFNRELPITNVPIYTCDIATEKLSSQQGHLRGTWKSYEQACEAAIKDCLENLI